MGIDTKTFCPAFENGPVDLDPISSIVLSNGLKILSLTSAITGGATATTTPNGTFAITSNATGVGNLFVSDGAHWQVLVTGGVTLAGAQTLLNKILTAPVINGGSINNGELNSMALGKLPLTSRFGIFGTGLAATSATAVHAAIALTGVVQTITTGITSPDHYRCAQVKGSQAGITGNVVITGTNRAGGTVTDTIALAGASAVNGVVPFLTETSIQVPVKVNGSGDTVSVGWCDKLGLARPIAIANDVSLVERIANGASPAVFVAEATGTVDPVNYTVIQATPITTGDIIRISYMASSI